MHRRRLKKERARTTRPRAQLRLRAHTALSTKPGTFAAALASTQWRPRRRPARLRRAAERPPMPQLVTTTSGAAVRRVTPSECRGGDPEQQKPRAADFGVEDEVVDDLMQRQCHTRCQRGNYPRRLRAQSRDERLFEKRADRCSHHREGREEQHEPALRQGLQIPAVGMRANAVHAVLRQVELEVARRRRRKGDNRATCATPHPKLAAIADAARVGARRERNAQYARRMCVNRPPNRAGNPGDGAQHRGAQARARLGGRPKARRSRQRSGVRRCPRARTSRCRQKPRARARRRAARFAERATTPRASRRRSCNRPKVDSDLRATPRCAERSRRRRKVPTARRRSLERAPRAQR